MAYPGDLGFNGFQWIIEIIENGEVWFSMFFFFFVNFQFQWIIIVLHQRFTIECAGWEVHFSDFFLTKRLCEAPASLAELRGTWRFPEIGVFP